MAWRSEKTKNDVLALFNTERELVVLDTETTGFSAEKNVVIQFSGIKFSIINGVLEEKERFNTYINPEKSLPDKIVEVTGITDGVLSSAPLERDVFPAIKHFLGKEPNICGHNVSFDLRFMKALYERNGEEFIPKTVIDTLEMARDLAIGAEDNKLGTLAALYGVDYGLTFHNSMDDVIACSRLLTVFVKEYKEKEEEAQATMFFTEKQKVAIKSLRYWPGFRGNSRIYIQTNCGDFYYDIRKKSWGKGKGNVYEIDMIDMEQLKTDALKYANACDEREFARFRG